MDLNVGSLRGSIEIDVNKLESGMAKGVNIANAGAAKLTDALGKPFAAARDETGKFTKSLGESTQQMERLGKESRATHSAISSIVSTAAGVTLSTMFTSAVGAAGNFTSSLIGIGLQGIKLSSQAESTSLAMTTMIGSAGLAQNLLKDLRTFANTTPFEFPELANAAKQLLAMGINARDVVPSLRMIGDVSSGLGQPVGEMAYLFGQIRSQGRAMTQDLNQFAGRGVPIYGELAKVLKTNELGVRALAEEGQISFAKINEAFASMKAEGGKFFNMTASQAETAQGLFSTLSDSIGDVEKQIGDALVAGTDGKSLLKEITVEIDNLKPTIVGLGVSLAGAFKNSLPAMKSALSYLEVIGDKIGLIDLNKMNGNPYAGASKESAEAVRSASNTPEGSSQLDRIQAGVRRGAAGAAEKLKGISLASKNDEGLEIFSDVLARRVEAAEKMIVAIREARAKGQAISDQQFQEARDQIARNLQQLGKLQERISLAMPGLDPDGMTRASAAQAMIRSAQIDAQRAIDDLSKSAAAAKAATIAAADRVKVGEWANDVSSSGLAGPASPAGNGGGGAAAGGARGFDVAGSQIAAQLKALEAAGKREQAELLKAKEDRDKEYARVDAAYNAGGLSVTDSVKASRAILLQYESTVKIIGDKFAKERENREAAEAKTNERIAAQAMREADKVKNHQLAAYAVPSGAQGRNAGPLASGPSTLAEAQDRVKKTKAGSGERELARLDLRDMLGKTLTDEETQRRGRLADRFGRDGVGLARRAMMPSPMARLAPLLARPARSGGGSQTTQSPANVNVTPTLNVDENKVAQACVRAMEPMVDRKLQRLAASLSDRNYASAASGGY